MNNIAKMVVKTFFRALGYYPIKINGVSFKVDPYHFRFWRAAARGKWEPNTYTIFSKFITNNSTYCDVGAWIGPTVLYAAKISKQVICFEPNPYAFRFLNWNLELNELNNVTALNVALTTRTGIERMSSFGGSLGDSMISSLADGSNKPGVDVYTITWEDFNKTYKTEKIDFIKIDIEGGEFTLLPTLEEYFSLYKPIVFLSTHPHRLDPLVRKEKMGQIIDIMRIYNKCLNIDLKPIDPQDLINEDSLNREKTFIFKN